MHFVIAYLWLYFYFEQERLFEITVKQNETMMPSSQDLLIFLCVTETRNITETARIKGISKSAVSQALKRLENQIGATLLFRTTRTMSLTDAGMKLLPLCHDYARLDQQMLDVIQSSGQLGPSKLTLTAPHVIGATFLPAILAQIPDADKTDIRLIMEDAQLNLVDQQVDLAIRVGHMGSQTARVTRIGYLQENLYAAPELICKMGGLPDHLAILADWPHIAHEWQGDPLTYHIADHTPLRVTAKIRNNSAFGVKAFIQAGAGIGLLPDLLVSDAEALVKIASISQTPVYCLHQYGATLPKSVKQIITLLKKYFKS